jgi:hypothetical protein
MSSSTKPTTATATTPARFELPALNLNFGSITDGTDIPPPPDSPVQKEPTPPQTPQKATQDTDADPEAGAETNAKPAAPANGNGTGNGTAEAPNANGKLTGTKRPLEDAPLSPPLSTRQGSLRRLFSRNTLNNSYLEGQQQAPAAAGIASPAPSSAQRPTSQGTTMSLVDDRAKSKRSSSWFKRLRGGDSASRRASMLPESTQAVMVPKTPSGPPPPMIPELTDLDKEDDSLGADLFKNIK